MILASTSSSLGNICGGAEVAVELGLFGEVCPEVGLRETEAALGDEDIGALFDAPKFYSVPVRRLSTPEKYIKVRTGRRVAMGVYDWTQE